MLVAVDASSAARPTLAAAGRIADLFDAELRVLHLIEPLPILPEAPPPMNPRDYERLLEGECAQKVWPLVEPDADKVIRHAPAEAGIADGTWRAQGDPTEIALLVAARKGGLDRTDLLAERAEPGELPFSSDRMFMASFHEDAGGERRD